ncbi:hypothetical protein DY78_GL002131 [Lactiplantibacillus fabifermentans DSM 21115]|uniref:Uncharacterized protein n=1 Tax=Lactiplantibacillus fabifermentans DSM 21115 TaxID=1413187 RepID=A0A0R2N8Y6_9LACO|nr:hypothetical protein DY78_GL002131 [Lactiplantibacillus fabifermentans DSM 21115]
MVLAGHGLRHAYTTDVFEDAVFGFKARWQTALWLPPVPTADAMTVSRPRH